MKHPRDLILITLDRLADFLDPQPVKASSETITRRPRQIAPPASDQKRHAPDDFPFPVWSDADLERFRAHRDANTTKGNGPKAGAWRLKDRRKEWQKKAKSTTFDRTGTVARMKQ